MHFLQTLEHLYLLDIALAVHHAHHVPLLLEHPLLGHDIMVQFHARNGSIVTVFILSVQAHVINPMGRDRACLRTHQICNDYNQAILLITILLRLCPTHPGCSQAAYEGVAHVGVGRTGQNRL